MKKAQRLIKSAILCICVVVVGYAMLTLQEGRSKLVYTDHLSDTAVTIDGEEISFEDLTFYILYEERVIEEEARVYNPDSTKDYWNLHTNGSFIQSEAKDVVMGMAIHDRLLYQLAVAEGMDTLTEAEEQELEYAKTDFWEDLLDIQWQKLPCDEDTINNQIYIAAIAEKYQNYIAKENGPSQAAYKYDGYYYKLIRDEHDVQINNKLWNRFVMGDITLHHEGINYINGLTDEDKEEKEE